MTQLKTRLRQLNGHVDIISGFAFKSARFGTSGLPLVRNRDLESARGTATFYAGPYDQRYLVKPGDILVGMDGDFRIATWRGPTALLNQRVCKLVSRRGSGLDQRFLFHALQRPLEAEQRKTSGTTVSHLSAQRIRALAVPAFSGRQQFVIAAVLDAIDEAIERTEAVISATERLRDALLHELLTRGVPGWHTQWRSVPGLGIIPADWQVVRLGDCIADGPTNGIYKPESDYGSGTWLIRIDDFIAGALVRSDGFERIRVSEEEAERYSIREGDILINRVNSLSHLGKSVLIPLLGEKALFESNMMKIKISSELNSKFVMIVLLSHASRRYVAARAKKAVQQASINQQDVSQLLVPLPSIEEQALIAQVSIAISCRLQRARSVLASMVAAQASVAKGMLEGQIRINSSNRTAGDFEAALEQTRSTEAQSSTHDQV